MSVAAGTIAVSGVGHPASKFFMDDLMRLLPSIIRAAGDAEMRERLGLTKASRIFVINTEGATDPERYAELVGITA